MCVYFTVHVFWAIYRPVFCKVTIIRFQREKEREKKLLEEGEIKRQIRKAMFSYEVIKKMMS